MASVINTRPIHKEKYNIRGNICIVELRKLKKMCAHLCMCDLYSHFNDNFIKTNV